MTIQPYVRKAHYYETDQMGIIHHSNYIRWLEEARIDLMDQMGFGYRRMEEEGISIPVLSAGCQYKSMVRFDDAVAIHIHMTQFTGTKMTMTYRILDAATGELRTLARTRHCFLNTGGRPVSLKKQKPEVYALFHDFLISQPPQEEFEVDI